MKILVAEDDDFTRRGLTDIFEEEGYKAVSAVDGEDALKVYHREKPDLVCLDIMMPKLNGYDVCKIIRKENKEVPVIFLSAKSEEIDKVLGLELGADDYISKPFGVKEVIARIRAVSRRCGIKPEHTTAGPFSIDDLTVYPRELKAARSGEDIELSLRDVKVLAFFAENQGKVLSRDELYDAGWGYGHLPNSRTLDQHISQLRKKIEHDPKNPKIITTVHTAGYRYPAVQ